MKQVFKVTTYSKETSKIIQRYSKDFTWKISYWHKISRSGLRKNTANWCTKRCYEIAQEIGSFAVVVDPIVKEAEKFVEKYDFIRLPDSKKMFLATKTLQELFG